MEEERGATKLAVIRGQKERIINVSSTVEDRDA
jgi:hypothetical protein